jgi:hypothetical protein
MAFDHGRRMRWMFAEEFTGEARKVSEVSFCESLVKRREGRRE